MSETPRNYTTTIPVSRTLGEVMGLLAEAGADQIAIRYAADRQPVGIAFSVRTADGVTGYNLALDMDRFHARLVAGWKSGSIRRGQTTREQAARVAWRTLQDWLEAQIELIRTELVSLDQVMLPFRVVDAGGTTVYEALQTGQLALPPAKGGEQ